MSLEPGMMVIVRKTSNDRNPILDGKQFILGEIVSIGKKSIGVKFYQDSGEDVVCFRMMDCIHKINPREIALAFTASAKKPMLQDTRLRDELPRIRCWCSPTWTRMRLDDFAERYKQFFVGKKFQYPLDS